MSIEVSYNSLYFSFDPKYNKLAQVLKVPNVPFNQTIEVKLTDSFDVSVAYYMVVEFVCTVNNNSRDADVASFYIMPQPSN